MPSNRIASVFLHNFSGTLHELLERIKKNQIVAAEILLRELSQQILVYCQKAEALECKADSLALTAQLILLKTKELLIQREEIQKTIPPSDPSLIRKLIDILDQKEKLSLRKLARKFPLPGKIKELPLTVSLVDLKALFAKFLKQTKNQPIISLKKEKWSLQELMKELLNLLFKECSFHEIFSPIKNKALLIFTFLALLELIKQQKVRLQTKENDIYFKTL